MKERGPDVLSFPALFGGAAGLAAAAAFAWLFPEGRSQKVLAAAACAAVGVRWGVLLRHRRRIRRQADRISRFRQELRLSQEHILSTGSFRSLGAWLDATMEDLRAPLRDLAAGSRSLASDTLLPEGTRRTAEQVAARSEEVGRLLGPLVSYALPAPSKAPFNVNNLLREAIDLCRHRAEERGIRFEERLAVVPPVFGPAGRVQSALLNVIVNAIEAMPHGGGDILVETSHQGERVVVRVRDSGIGIRPEHLGKVFDPFFSTKPDRGCAGLGLWETRESLDRIGGSIAVRSVALEGTEVTLSFQQSAPLAAGRAGVEHPPELKRNTA